MNSIVRWQISSLLYLLVLTVIVQIVMYLRPTVDPYKAVQLALIIPAALVVLWKLRAFASLMPNYRTGNAAVAMVFWFVVPFLVSVFPEIDGRFNRQLEFATGGVACLAIVSFVIVNFGPKIIPFLFYAIVIQAAVFYFTIIEPEYLNPLFTIVIGLLSIVGLYIFTSFAFPSMLHPEPATAAPNAA